MASGTRLSFCWWWAAGCGAAGVIVEWTTRRWDILSNTSTHVTARESELPAPLLIAILVAGCALAIGAGAHRAVAGFPHAARRRLRLAASWAFVAALVAAALVYLAYSPVEGGRGISPLHAHLLLTLPAGGLLGGVAWAVLLRVPAGSLSIALGWTIAFFVVALVAPIVLYLVGGGTIDAIEALGLSGAFGRVVGYFLTGAILGSMVGAIGAVTSVPALENRREHTGG